MLYSLKIMVTGQVAKTSYIFSLFINMFIGLITDQNDRKQKKCTGFMSFLNKDILGIFQKK